MNKLLFKYLNRSKLNSVMVIVGFLLLTNPIKSQPKEYYSHNFVLKGKIMDGETGQLLINKCFTVLAFDKIRTVCSNEKGEYLIKFFDTTGVEDYESFEVPDGELIFISGEDPNKQQTIYLNKTKVKKSYKKDDCTEKPLRLTFHVKLEFDF